MIQLVSKQNVPKATEKVAPALQLQTSPPVYVIVISGEWLLKHTTPSWRIKDPIKGFQRIVNEARARQIARTVLDQERAFPNAITLATDIKDFKRSGTDIVLPSKAKFLVVDGQHRLWAQTFSDKDGQYVCIIHLNKTEREMAQLFLEINDNQRRVPSSLRWDLVRLVRPTGDEAGVMAADLVYELANREDSPFYFSIDLTGEQKDVSIKQGSLAPEIKTLVGKIKKVRKPEDPTFEEYASLLIRFFSAVRSLNPQGWGDTSSTYYKARVLRALIRVLADIALNAGSLDQLTAPFLLRELQKIDPTTLSDDRVRAAQGSAGVTDLYQEMKSQVFA
jgi:DGQHR domain-containing protein